MSSSSVSLLEASLGAGVTLLLLLVFFRTRAGPPFPPGPKGLPIIGNLLDMPSSYDWITFAEWGRKFGGIVGLRLLRRPMIIVNSFEDLERFDKLSVIYSDRPRLEMAGELAGYSQALVLMSNDTPLRNSRRHVARMIGSPSLMSEYHALEEEETHRFLQRVVAGGEDLSDALRNWSGSIIIKLTYGIQIREKNDPIMKMLEVNNENFGVMTAPGAFLVDVFPILKYIPEWFPGGQFKKLAREYRKVLDDVVEHPFVHAKKLIASGEAPPSFISKSTEDEDKLTPEELKEVKFTAATLYAAGADTTMSSQYTFFLAMVMYPDVQRKAQAELDAVVGSDRLPVIADRDRLPYLQAIVSEVLRWSVVAPLGFPHYAREDHIVNGYHIPKESIILANIWGMQHDPAVYPDPFTFDPERFIGSPGKPPQQDPRRTCFGFGRRICPGMHLAEASLFICIAMSLAVFNITTALDEDGKPIIPVYETTPGGVIQPKPFKYKVETRSEKALALITADYH